MSNDNSNEKNKILWLSIVQGWAILLVLIGHVNTYTYSGIDGELYPLGLWIHNFCYAFHMPLFMFVSGGLLYLTRIERGWSTRALYRDKAVRLLVPYLAFSVIGFLIKAPLSSISKRGMDVSFSGFMAGVFNPAAGPLVELWFIGTLMWLMLMYPLYKEALRNPWTEAALLLITLIPFLLGTTDVEIAGWFHLRGVFEYAFYFVAGMLFFKYRLARFIDSIYCGLGLAALFIIEIVFCPQCKLLGALTGILMSVSFGTMAARRFPGLFSTFRDHTFQIFLFGLFPQMFVELIVWTRVHDEWLQLPFYAVSVGGALCFSVLMSKLVRKIKSRYVRWAFGLK